MKQLILLLALCFTAYLQAGVAIVPGDEPYYSSGDEILRLFILSRTVMQRRRHRL